MRKEKDNTLDKKKPKKPATNIIKCVSTDDKESFDDFFKKSSFNSK